MSRKEWWKVTRIFFLSRVVFYQQAASRRAENIIFCSTAGSFFFLLQSLRWFVCPELSSESKSYFKREQFSGLPCHLYRTPGLLFIPLRVCETQKKSLEDCVHKYAVLSRLSGKKDGKGSNLILLVPDHTFTIFCFFKDNIFFKFFNNCEEKIQSIFTSTCIHFQWKVYISAHVRLIEWKIR